jgi:hypothetical protein
MGPVLICGSPWSTGDTFIAGSSMTGPPARMINSQQLIAYDDTGLQCPEQGTNCQLSGYTGSDIWSGAMYVSIGGSETLLFAGRKCLSNQSYYCPSQGWWCGPNPGGTNCTSAPVEPRLLFYDVDQIGQVAAGAMSYHAIQPYAHLSLPEPFPVRPDPVYGSYGHTAYDSATQRLYVIQRYVGPNAEPIVHVFQLSGLAEGLRGDLNNDGSVSLGDLRLQIQMLTGSVPADMAKADLDGSGTLTLADVRALIQILVAP